MRQIIFFTLFFLLIFADLNAQKAESIQKMQEEKLDKNGELTEIRRYYKNGNIKCIIPVAKDKAHGTVKCFKKDGTLKAENNYINGKQNGKQFSFMKKSTYIVTYENGIENKIFHVIRYYKDGKIKEEYNNKFFEGYGSYRLNYKNGKEKIEGQYLGIKRNDIWNFYNEDGSLKKTKNYEECKVVFSFRQFL